MLPSAVRPLRASGRQGKSRHRRAHPAEERGDPLLRLPEVHRQLRLRRGLADGAGNDRRQALADEPKV